MRVNRVCEPLARFLHEWPVMTDAILKLKLDGPETEHRIAEAVEAYTLWRADSAVLSDADLPAIMVKTAYGPGDAIYKTIVFESAYWAEFFLVIWAHLTAA